MCCECCPRAFPVEKYPGHKNLFGLVRNFLVINHYQLKLDLVIEYAENNQAVYYTEEETYYFILFGGPGNHPKAYTLIELKGVLKK